METDKFTPLEILLSGVVIIVGLFLLLFLLMGWEIVDSGYRGVVVKLGKVQDEILDEGLWFKWPLLTSIKELNVQIQKIESKNNDAASKDLQTVTTDLAVNYHLEPSAVANIYKNLRHEYEWRIISPSIDEVVKQVTAEFTAEELIKSRADAKEKMRFALAERTKDLGIMIDDISITNFSFSEEFDKAIEAKQTAVQQAQKAVNDLERIKAEADQKIASATAEAEAIRIQAEAITQQGGQSYVNLKAVEKWNGVLPVQMIPGATVPFLNLTK